MTGNPGGKFPLLYAGIHHPSMARRLPRAMLSVNGLIHRRSPFHPRERYRDQPQARNRVEACLEWLQGVESIRPRTSQLPMGM